nr:hypothetical protein [Formosa agariphila]
MKIFSLIILIITCLSCNGNSEQINRAVTKVKMTALEDKEELISVGANQTDVYLPLLKGKKVGVTANQTSVIFKGDNQSQ